jgi:hypothetical protein
MEISSGVLDEKSVISLGSGFAATTGFLVSSVQAFAA